ncbi:hypothetical protein LLEC1_05624 [Akanthomyces lecanii]|uniref:Uncharacterized protein n=1 Tax=Cordyceps confragosa TaxID=2714763 RepID=A0A179I5E7_CORDF|nr:hypothetical protein LLEC1_05624 [Akanthomyces lecanii]
MLFNLGDSQFTNTLGGIPAGSSCRTSSYIIGTNRKQYMAISYALISADTETCYRTSVLALDKLSNCNCFIVYSSTRALAAESQLRVTVRGNGFQSLTGDNVSQMRTCSNHDKVTLGITHNATSSALVDAGTDLFTLGTGKTYEWAFPSCDTEGTLRIDGKLGAIDPAKLLLPSMIGSGIMASPRMDIGPGSSCTSPTPSSSSVFGLPTTLLQMSMPVSRWLGCRWQRYGMQRESSP